MNDENIRMTENEEVIPEDNTEIENQEEFDQTENEPEDEIAPSESVESLKEEISALKKEIANLEKLRETQDRILSELGDFNSLFPEAKVEDIPDSVWDSVRRGASLAASFALYEKRSKAEAARANEINQRNAVRSAGIAGQNTANEFFTPDEVRKMSRSEVHANYTKIRDSMKKWN